MLTPCPEQIAEPLTTGDPFDLARALVQATRYAKVCAAQQGALIDAVNGRDRLMDAVTKQSR